MRNTVRNTMKQIVTIIATLAIAFTSLPAMAGNLDAHAAAPKAPAQVKNLKATTVTQTSVKLTWNKIAKNKNTKGYAIYRNGKFIKRVSYKTNVFNDTKLKAGTKYKYTVRAYNTYKQTQYYNSKTKKWQAKKPTAAQWKGKKTRKVTAYKYGKVSATKVVTTKKVVKKSTSNNSSSNNSSNSGSNSSGSEIPDTKLKAEPAYAVYIEENNPVLTITYNANAGNVSWTVEDPSIVKIVKSSDNNGVAKLTLGGGTNYGRTYIRVTYNKKYQDKYYNGYTTHSFYVENKKVITCSSVKLENRLPIYDYSYPSFNGIPASSVKKVLDFDASRNVERAIISCSLSKPLEERSDSVEFFNKTTGEKLWGPSSTGMFGAPLNIGFDIVKAADISNPQSVSISSFGFATRTGSGKYVFAIELEPGTIVAGNNTIDMQINGKAVKTFTVNVKSRADRYYQFAKSVYDASGSSYYSPEDKKCTGDVTLLRKLRGIEDYINDQYEYPACVKSSFGNACVVTIGNTGRQIDRMNGGCEDGAIMMSLCAMYCGVDATYKYVNGHCICYIPNSTSLFGFEKTFDATPHSGYYTSASQDRMVEYLNSIQKIIY